MLAPNLQRYILAPSFLGPKECRVELHILIREYRKTLDVLRSIEWSGGHCPECGAINWGDDPQDHTHNPNCALHAALGGAPWYMTGLIHTFQDELRASKAWTTGPEGRRFWGLVEDAQMTLRDNIRHGLDWGWVPGDTKTIRQAIRVRP